MKRFNRGNAVPETALVVSFTLLILFGVVQLATVTFYQVSADGASFVGAHDTVQNVGAPTTANLSSAQSSARSAFVKIASATVSVLNPSTSTFETDVQQNIPGVTSLGGTSGPVAVTSRIVEESSGSTPTSGSLLPDCTSAVQNLVNGGTGQLSTTITNAGTNAQPYLGLLPVSQLYSTVSEATSSTTSTNVIDLNTTPLTNRIGALNAVSTALTNTIAALNALPAALNAIPLLSTILTPVTNALSTTLNSIVQEALSGTLGTSASTLATVDSALTSLPTVGALVTPLLSTINAVLTGAGGTVSGTGLLGPNGPLQALNTAEAALKVIDAGATKICAAN